MRSKYFNINRKSLYIILLIMVFFVSTLTLVYAALSTTLNISGNAEVTAASWDIYLDNIQLNSRSATSTKPTIINKTTTSFTTALLNPGDFYEFTVDVVNNGTIDAMIDSVTKTPELTTEQAKYLKYEVLYQNGKSIDTKQLLEKNSFVRIKVKIAFRSDISTSDIPSSAESLTLSFKVNYVQSNEPGSSIENNGKKIIHIVNGDFDTIGSEIAIGDEHFYLISSNEQTVTLLAKYNLYVGGLYNGSTWTTYGEEATGKQDANMIGYLTNGEKTYNGVTGYSTSNYWSSSNYPFYMYNSNSIIYKYVENYKTYLQGFNVKVNDARLIKVEELEALGCNSSSRKCTNAPSWVYATSYWTGSALGYVSVWIIYNSGTFSDAYYYDNEGFGVRPVITIPISEF